MKEPLGRAKDLAYWINARDAMRVMKEEMPGATPPWSTDPNMANVRYCNVHREDDRVTRWIRDNWRTPNAQSPLLTLGMVTARMINWPDTLDMIGFPKGEFDVWATYSKEMMRFAAQDGDKVWTSAYTISTCGRKMNKEDYVFDHVLASVADLGIINWTSHDGTEVYLSNAHRLLTSIDGLGSFLSAQVVADLKNTPGHPLKRAVDRKTWCAPGPGSLRGLAAYWGAPIKPATFQRSIKEAYDETMEFVDTPSVGDIDMQDFQNTLCEFSKYIRVKEGDGRVRNKYRAVG